MNPNWIERLAGSTRGAMLALLRRSRHTISELASALGITDNAVRTHIASLQRDGLVEQSGVRRDQRGKPAHVFDLTTTAEELFPKAYAAILKELIVRLEERDGPEAVEALLRGIGGQIGAHHFHESAEMGSRVESAAAALRSLGGEIRIESSPEGYDIRGHGCPLSAVVRGYHGTCVVAESLIAGATGGDVTELCEKGMRPRCAFHVTPAASGSVGQT